MCARNFSTTAQGGVTRVNSWAARVLPWFAACLVFAGVLLFLLKRWLGPRARGLGARLKQGCAIMCTPRKFILGVG